jgi:hypothetical protein
MPIKISVAAGTSEAMLPARGAAAAGRLPDAFDVVGDDDELPEDPRSHPIGPMRAARTGRRARRIVSKKSARHAAGR